MPVRVRKNKPIIARAKFFWLRYYSAAGLLNFLRPGVCLGFALCCNGKNDFVPLRQIGQVAFDVPLQTILYKKVDYKIIVAK